MKNTNLTRAAASLLACGMVFGLTACGSSTSSSEATAESAASSESTVPDDATAESATESATGSATESAVDDYAYLADFSFSDAYDENGYLKGITALDYVTLPETDGFTLSDTATTVSDSDIDEYISSNILSNYKTTNEITNRAAENGDTVNIDFAGSIDGVAFDGGTGSDYDLTLGSGTFIDGFEDQIVGHMPGETFDVNVTFPDDYQATNLAGKDAVFATTLNYINEDVTPDLTDDWVSSNLAESMGMNNVAELKNYVNNSLLFNQEANELYGQLYDAVEVNTDTLPEDVQQYFTNTVLYQPYLYAQMYGVSLETMLSQAGYSSVDEYLENSESSKQSMIKQILIMQALAEKNNIVCDTDILNAEFSRYFGSTDMTSYVNAYGENYVKTNILHDVVMQNLIDNVA